MITSSLLWQLDVNLVEGFQRSGFCAANLSEVESLSYSSEFCGFQGRSQTLPSGKLDRGYA